MIVLWIRLLQDVEQRIISSCNIELLQDKFTLFATSSRKPVLVLITLTKYKTAFIIQVLCIKQIFSTEVLRPFWSAGASARLTEVELRYGPSYQLQLNSSSAEPAIRCQAERASAQWQAGFVDEGR